MTCLVSMSHLRELKGISCYGSYQYRYQLLAVDLRTMIAKSKVDLGSYSFLF